MTLTSTMLLQLKLITYQLNSYNFQRFKEKSVLFFFLSSAASSTNPHQQLILIINNSDNSNDNICSRISSIVIVAALALLAATAFSAVNGFYYYYYYYCYYYYSHAFLLMHYQLVEGGKHKSFLLNFYAYPFMQGRSVLLLLLLFETKIFNTMCLVVVVG